MTVGIGTMHNSVFSPFVPALAFLCAIVIRTIDNFLFELDVMSGRTFSFEMMGLSVRYGQFRLLNGSPSFAF